jgi:membrane protein DedA with SNARE-associated domain
MPLFIETIKLYGIAGIFFSLMAENMGVPLPTEGAYLVAHSYISHGRYSFWSLFWLMVAAQMIGSTLSYVLGRILDRQLLHRLNRSSKFLRANERIHNWYEKYGSVTVLGTKLIGYVRPYSSFVAGIANYPFWSFTWWSIVGTLIIVYITMKATGLLVIVWQRFPGGPVIVSIGVLLGFLGFLIFLWRPEQKKEP